MAGKALDKGVLSESHISYASDLLLQLEKKSSKQKLEVTKMKKLYDEYFEHCAELNEATEEAFEGMADAYSSWYKLFLPDDKTTRILDIGAGVGHFLCFLKREGHKNYCGLDVSANNNSLLNKV